MDTITLELLVGVLLVLAVVGVAAWAYARRRRSEALRDRFGPEYERVVTEYGDKQLAEERLRAREERVEALELRALEPDERLRFLRQWRVVQAQFVDDPSGATAQANTLIKEVMRQRGYPMGDFDRRAEDVSVRHPEVVQHYRAAREIAQRNEHGQAATEDLRQALVHYRALFQELLDERMQDARREDKSEAQRTDTRRAA